jgi:hypothetical protein
MVDYEQQPQPQLQFTSKSYTESFVFRQLLVNRANKVCCRDGIKHKKISKFTCGNCSILVQMSMISYLVTNVNKGSHCTINILILLEQVCLSKHE